MTENSGRVCVCMLVQKQESAGKSWLSVGAHSWPGWGKGCGWAATSEEAPCLLPPSLPLWSGGRGLTADLRVGLFPWQGSK